MPAFKDNLRHGAPHPATAPTAPTAPPPGDVPDDFLPGVLTRLIQLVHRIKNAPAYTDAVGHRLGLIGPNAPPTTPPPNQPSNSASSPEGTPKSAGKKSHFTGLIIEVDRGADWEFLAHDTIPHYLDKFPIPKTGAVWKYRAMYVKADQRVGQWSDEASISLGAGE